MKTKDWKNRWAEVNEIVFEALELDEAERREFVRDRCRNAPELLNEVESMLAAESEAEDFFGEPAAINYAGFLETEDNPEALAGQEIGNYRIIREIGRGGMGSVYLAERADGNFEQQVALKLLRRELNTQNIRRRFRHERQILAALQHPNIARLLDAGTTADGIPFLAMEYIEGVPVDTFCNKQNYNLEKRLKIFRVICEAVAFAHRNLVVHRDLKPSNILVTGDGIPKLLDFGISKLLTPEFEAESEHTITKLGAMTPNYASPEQLKLSNALTTSDVYSLGVILYELLSGQRPFEKYEGNLQQIIQAVCGIEPLPPSAIVKEAISPERNRIDETTIRIGENNNLSTSKNPLTDKTQAQASRQTNPQFIFSDPQRLRGDLDNIILKALKKEPERRYPSVEFFSEDIRRHLDGLPVTARPDTISYRAEKFIKRHRAGVFAGILISLAITGGLIATLWQSQVARAERTKAEKRFNDVRALANSFLFEFSPKIENLPGSMPARQLLVTRALEYLDNLSQESADNLQLQGELAKAYEKVGDVQGNPQTPNIGDLKGALASYEKAQAIRRRLLEINPGDADNQTNLAGNLEGAADISITGGDSAEAEADFAEAVALREKVLAPDPRNFTARSNLASTLRKSGFLPFYNSENEKAMEFFRRSLAIFAELSREAPDDGFVNMQHANLYLDIGESFSYMDDAAQAQENIQRGMEMLSALYEKNTNNTRIRRAYFVSLLKRGELYRDDGDEQTSLAFYNRALDLAQTARQNEPGSFQAKRDVVIAGKQRAVTLRTAGQIEDAIKSFSGAIEVSEQLKREDPDNILIVYDVAGSYQEMSELYYKTRNFTETQATAEKAQENCRFILEKNPAHIQAKTVLARSKNMTGAAYIGLAEKIDRRDLWEKALENLRASLVIYEELKVAGKFSATENEKVEVLKTEIAKAEKRLNGYNQA